MIAGTDYFDLCIALHRNTFFDEICDNTIDEDTYS
jgi:hypothetical protein